MVIFNLKGGFRSLTFLRFLFWTFHLLTSTLWFLNFCFFDPQRWFPFQRLQITWLLVILERRLSNDTWWLFSLLLLYNLILDLNPLLLRLPHAWFQLHKKLHRHKSLLQLIFLFTQYGSFPFKREIVNFWLLKVFVHTLKELFFERRHRDKPMLLKLLVWFLLVCVQNLINKLTVVCFRRGRRSRERTLFLEWVLKPMLRNERRLGSFIILRILSAKAYVRGEFVF